MTQECVVEGLRGAADFCGALDVCCDAVGEVLQVCCGVPDGVDFCCGVLEAVVEMAVQVCSVVVEAGVGGVKIGVVTVHLLHVVTVSVVRNVEVLVIISMDVFPPLWWVVVETGQLVTVV